MTLIRTIVGQWDAQAGRRLVPATLVAAAVALCAAASPACAATFTAHDGASLIAAVHDADAQTGPSTINLSPGVYTPNATLTLTGAVTLAGPSGPGLKIVGSAVLPVGSTLFAISANAAVTFVNLSVSTAGGVGGDPAVDVAGTLDVENSALVGNAGPDLMIEPGGSATVRNSTLSDGLGTGLVDDGSAKLINATVADNAVEGIDDSTGTISLVNTVVAGNGSPDCSAVAASTDHSLDSDGSCGVGALSHVNADLGPLLASNGGPTPTHALGPGSPAIDAGDEAQCPAEDQRHYPRADGRCDIGAYEAGAQSASGSSAGSSGTSPGGSGGGAGIPKSPGPKGAGSIVLSGASGHGVLRGSGAVRIRFSVHARVAKPRGSLIYHDATHRVWLKALRLNSVRIDAATGTATIKGGGEDLIAHRRVTFVAILTDHGSVRSLTIRLSSGYAGGGRLLSGAVALTGGKS